MRILHPIHLAFLTVSGLLLGAGLFLAYFVALTPAGAEWAIRKALAGRLGSEEAISINRTIGSLASGLSLHGVAIWHPRGLPPGSSLEADHIDLLPGWPSPKQRLKATVRQVRVKLPGTADEITAVSVEGGMGQAWRVKELRVAGIKRLPRGSVIDVQQLDMGWPLSAANIRAIRNGRLRFRYSDPVVFSGTQQDGVVNFQMYARKLDIQELLQAAGRPHMRRVRGAIDGVEFAITGPVQEPMVEGRFRIEELSYQNRSLLRALGMVKLRVSMPADQVRLDGAVTIASGELQLAPTAIRIEHSRIQFAGNPSQPELNLKGSAKVQDTNVHITVKGSFAKPDVVLQSYPPLPQDRLLLMLATGKSWGSAETSLQEGALSPDAAKDFLDFVVFGGQAGRLARRLGISDVSLRYDPEKGGMGVTTVFFDRIGASYDIELAPEDQRDPAVQKLGAEYKLTDATAVAVEGTRELSQSRRPASQVPGASTAIDENVIEKLLLKYKLNFW